MLFNSLWSWLKKKENLVYFLIILSTVLTSGLFFFSPRSKIKEQDVGYEGNIISELDLTSINSDLKPEANNTRDLGGYSNAFNDLFASGTAYLTNVSTTQGIYPTANNAVDLGGYTRAWNEVFVSSSAFLTSSTVENPTATTTVYLTSGGANFGGRVILKAATGATCYQIYFGNPNSDGTGPIGLTTSTITCPNL